MNARAIVFVGAMALLWPWSAFAHDYWLVPAQYVVPSDRDVNVSLFVGEDFVGDEEKHFEHARTTRLTLVRADKTEDILPSATEGALPMLQLHIQGSGGHLLAVDRNASRIELEAKKFETYLHDEGLDSIIQERARRGESSKPGRERYTRYLKALIQEGAAADATYGVVVGQNLELAPTQNPVFASPGSTFPWIVRFQGVPLAGAQIEALSRVGADIRKTSYTSDAQGRVNIVIDRRGVWLVRMVHMIRCDGCDDADWASFWTSYSFATADESGAVVEAPSMLSGSVSAPPISEPVGRWRLLAIAFVILTLASTLYFVRRRRTKASST